MKRYVTKTVTIVLQCVQGQAEPLNPQITTALQEYIDDCKAGEAGGAGYERHVQKNGVRMDVIASVYPDPKEIARERDIDGDGDRALIERLQKIRSAARFLTGQSNAGVMGAAYTPQHAATDITDWAIEALAAHGIVDEPEEEPGDVGG